MTMDYMDVISQHESEVRSYVRGFPTTFAKASGSYMYDTEGRAYLDFFAGASVMNYGHNHPELKKALIEYLSEDNITHSLDMASVARAEFLEAFNRLILEPRNMRYKVQFPGPTGTNAVETALKLARKVKGRDTVMAFTNAFHGMTLGSLSVTGNGFKRQGAGLTLDNASHMPFDHYMGPGTNTLDYIDRMLADSASGIDRPAAVITETVQAEGGVNVADLEWLRGLEKLCRKYDMLLIVDDIQTGLGRCGSFFSFEAAGISPDMVTLSKSLSGYGLPLAVTLIKPEYDIWAPGEHNGTFRGQNPSFVTARRTLELFWSDDAFEQEIARRGKRMAEFLEGLAQRYPQAQGSRRGRGMMQAIEFGHVELAEKISEIGFRHGLIIETAGTDDQVLKLLPPCTTEDADLEKGLAIIEKSLVEAMDELGISRDRAAGE
ncbi:diaminobutyrate--2-oxoglutarate transaminase [Aquisalimonas lutea]|uniref:diaminobutyrate--2-oxoglutarate transaminase n=1 Tax=Aquisalimonas lutea TaxID=1327750 RepID=UPI0025B5573F|nr:diaminobutyrate--2-oxoglutarate transaminase [Aquisalimonas lutea]MDN3519661.1 diaminobutyrate--2-oxoglutarate transaminase [Aquisalimonas lutea]